MNKYKIGMIGTGPNPENPGANGYAMAYQHAPGYQELENCEIIACADLVKENAVKFAKKFGLNNIYTDYKEMLRKEKPDIVSICTWPEDHKKLVVGCAREGVKAIHCEKPMAYTWKDCKTMAFACKKRGINLTFNHQRRFGKPFRKTKELIDKGEIGELRKVEFSVGNLYDYGSHSVDMCGYFNNEIPARWVMAQIDYRKETLVFGAHNENQALALWEYDNGVYGMASTGKGAGLIDCHNRVVGSEGIIEIGKEDGPVLRVKRKGSTSWEKIDCEGEDCHGPGYIKRAIKDVVQALDKGEKSELCAENALKSTEIIFACWESSRRRARIDLPLEIEDNPLDSMVISGDLNPESSE